MAFVRAPRIGLLERLDKYRKETKRRAIGRSLIVFEFPTKISDQYIPRYGADNAGVLTPLHFLIDLDYDYIDFRSVVERDFLRSTDAMGQHAVCRARTQEEGLLGPKIYEFICQEIIRGTKCLSKILSVYEQHQLPLNMPTAVDLIRGLDRAPVLSVQSVFSTISSECHLEQMVKDCVTLGDSDKQSGFVKMLVTVDAKSVGLGYDKKNQLFYCLDSSITDVGARLMIIDYEKLSELIDFLTEVVLVNEDRVRRQTVAVVVKNRRKAINRRSLITATFDSTSTVSDNESSDNDSDDSDSTSGGSGNEAGKSPCRSSDDFDSDSDDDPTQLLCIDWTHTNVSNQPQIMQAAQTFHEIVTCPRRLRGRSKIGDGRSAG